MINMFIIIFVWFVYLVGQVICIGYVIIHTCVLGYELTDKDNAIIACVMIPGVVLNAFITIVYTINSNHESEGHIKLYEIPHTSEVGIEENDDVVIGVTQPHGESNKQQYVIIINP
jgi:hypothetical protein